MTKKRCKEILRQVYESKGGTYLANGELFTIDTGYQVGVMKIAKRDLGEKDLLKLIQETFILASLNEVCFEVCNTMFPRVGFWIDGDTIHIDLSRWIPSLEKAMKIAIINNEDSIWDWSSMESVKTA